MGTLANPVTPIPQFSDPDLPLIPPQLRAGDSWNWSAAFPNYPSTQYTLQYIFNSDLNRFALGAGAITPDADALSFDIQASTAITAPCTPDAYDVAAVLTGISGTSAAGQQVTIPLQRVTVLPNLAAATAPVDSRSFIKKTLDMIEAAIGGNTRPDVQEYEIQGRQIRKIDPLDMLRLRQEYKALYRAEQRANGEYVSPRKIGFRIRPTF